MTTQACRKNCESTEVIMNFETDNNKVYLCGVIDSEPSFSHEIYGEGFYDTTLKVKRLSMQDDIIPITISERLINEQNLSVGKSLALKGQFRSYNKLVGGKSKLMLTVFVREIVPPELNENSNSIELIGYICKEPVYRTTPFKREICDLLLAVNRAYNKSDYLPCIAWGRSARFISQVGVGEKLYISGRIQSREYQKKLENGQTETRTAYEVSISRVSTKQDQTDLGLTQPYENIAQNHNSISVNE